ncbi:GntR family transcriptional regulator [Oceanimonas baumannii]|uniref:GntR family transcriptional regulator n=1 Tax=Oceanimonas baumannii TaxID=129578 RepID=A0A235CH35_9GAMM|nr:GntR family transcriptional regulator [Oceanimonas baumannii]OYD23921.1 GntR family transcriptional regulator [Oceanimonas baumannii]TDW58747.1 GntR family transcriptional regulator [Oceanimonas baumannii]
MAEQTVVPHDSELSETEERELTKSANLTERLINLIVKGEFAAGSKISEPELARRFGVSRGPLREAIMRVESLGLIERAPHVGARVIALSRAKLMEIYAVREALEGMAVRLACQHITEQELDALQQLLDTHKAHIEEVEGASYFHQQGDFDFHYRLIQASRNSTLIGLLCDELYHLLRMYRHQSQRSHSRPQQALSEHFHLLAALRERDAELAEMLMRRHIMRSRLLIEQQLKDEQGASV